MEPNMEYPNFYVLTGAMGAGKSTIIEKIAERAIICVPEPARPILREQRLIKARGVPEADPDLFTQLMLSRATHQFESRIPSGRPVIFDRGIPDMIAYAELFSLSTEIYRNAALEYRYNRKVFWFEGWRDIYAKDEERKMEFEAAAAFGHRVRAIYEALDYEVVPVPPVPIADRVDFILSALDDRG